MCIALLQVTTAPDEYACDVMVVEELAGAAVVAAGVVDGELVAEELVAGVEVRVTVVKDVALEVAIVEVDLC